MKVFLELLSRPVEGYKTFNHFTVIFAMQTVLTALILHLGVTYLPNLFKGGVDGGMIVILIASSLIFSTFNLVNHKKRYIADMDRNTRKC